MMSYEQVLYKGENYQLYLFEKEHIFHPKEVGVGSIWPTTDPFEYQNSYRIDDRNLILESTLIHGNVYFREVHGCPPKYIDDNNDKMAIYEHINIPLEYSGAMIIRKDFIDKYGFDEEYPCYCYKNVFELIFNEGCLITAIDHSRAMLKIRKNIDAGLRDPKVKKDIRCINRFIKSSFIGEYKIKMIKHKNKKSILHPFRKRKIS